MAEFETITGEALAKTKETTTAAGGKAIVEAGAHGVGMALSPLVLGGFAALSAVVNQMEYNHQRDKITRFYSEELSAKLDKPKAIVTKDDLTVLEKGKQSSGIEQNNVIKQALSKERWKRNVGIGASFVASIATFALINAILPGGAGIAAFAAKVAVSVLTYMAIKEPIANFANHLIGNDRETAHDKIVAIAKGHKHGKSVSKQQLVDVFIAGNKDLQAHIEKNYGVFYDELPVIDKAEITRALTEHLPIEAIQKNINAGITDASELAFTVQGDLSGVLPKAPELSKRPSRLGALAHKLEATGEKLSHWLKKDDQSMREDFQDVKRIAQDFVATSKTSTPVEYDNESTRKFTDAVGRAPVDVSMSNVERLAQARNAQIMAPSSNTIH